MERWKKKPGHSDRAFGFGADYYSVPFSAALIMFSFAEM